MYIYIYTYIHIYVYIYIYNNIQEESLTVAQGDKGALILRFAPIDAPREETLLIKLKVLTLAPSLPPSFTPSLPPSLKFD
jgi:hypothetical protein